MTLGLGVITTEADIEDLFDTSFYLKLLEVSGGPIVKPTQLSGSGRIIKQIEAVAGHSFDHYSPARYFLEHQTGLLPELSEPVLGGFEQLFQRINALLE